MSIHTPSERSGRASQENVPSLTMAKYHPAALRTGERLGGANRAASACSQD